MASLLGIEPSQLLINDLAVTSEQARDFKSELADRGTHSIYCGIVLAGISRIFYKSFDWPQLNVLCRGMREHTRTFQE